MRIGITTAAIAMAVSLVGCGRTATVEEPTVEAATAPTLESTTTVAPTPTLGVTSDEFVDTWNRLLAVHRFLLIDEFDVDDGTVLIRRFTEDWRLELAVDPQSGELSEATLWGSFNVHTDMAILFAITLFTLVDASNEALDLDVIEDIEWVFERLGLPPFEGDMPEGFGTGSYASEGVIEGVIYAFEESGDQARLTARPNTR